MTAAAVTVHDTVHVSNNREVGEDMLSKIIHRLTKTIGVHTQDSQNQTRWGVGQST